MSSSSTKEFHDRVLTALCVGLVLLLVLLRLVYLSADIPPWVSGSDGLYVDEGYKTLSPRNLVLFGATHWSPADLYEGWMSESPVTQWCYYASFFLFGVDIEAARYVTVLFLSLFLLGFVLAMRGRYSGVLLLGGLALLGLENTLFFLSRVAIFEFPIITLFYGLLFVFAGMKASRLVTPVLAAIGISVVLVFGIKVSALLYLAPVFLAFSVFVMLQEGSRQSSTRVVSAIVAALVLGALLVLTRGEWVGLLEFNPLDIGSRILDNPLVHSSPVPVLAGLLCALHLLSCRPDLCLKNLYRIALVSVALLGIPLVAVFDYHPMRYYSPLLPAYVLVVLEWIHLRGWRFPAPRSSWLGALVTLAFMVPWLYFMIGMFLTYKPGLFSGDAPGLLELAVVIVPAAVLSAFRSVALRGVVVASALLLMLPWFLVYNTRQVGSFLLGPAFQAQQIRSDLVNQLPEDSIIGGVWAPFFALGTPLKALYVAREGTPSHRLPSLAPDYVIATESTGNSSRMALDIRSISGIRLGPGLYTATYNKKQSTVYPLVFDSESPTSERRGPHDIGRSLMRLGDPAAAEPSLRVWLDEVEEDPAAEPAWVAEARSDWGECVVHLGRYAEAEQALLSAYEVFRPRGEAPARISVRVTLNRLVELYRVWNKPEQLAKYRSLLERSQREE